MKEPAECSGLQINAHWSFFLWMFPPCQLLLQAFCLNENVIRILKLAFPLEAEAVKVTGVVQLPIGKHFQQMGIGVSLKVLD